MPAKKPKPKAATRNRDQRSAMRNLNNQNFESLSDQYVNLLDQYDNDANALFQQAQNGLLRRAQESEEERPTKRQRTMNFIINNQNKLAAGTAVISTGMTLLGIPVTPLVLSAAAASAISYFMERSNLNCKGEAASSSAEHRDDHNRDRDDENNNNPPAPASTSNRAASILV